MPRNLNKPLMAWDDKMRFDIENLISPGEQPVENAPVLRREDAGNCIPQHFLRYAHSIETVEAIVSRISYDVRYPIFVSQDGAGLFIQIGVVGPDNYKSSQDKLVYGRRWRVEPNLPTSEIIQTVFLALKKAREHEMRERFVLDYDGRKTTPFNGHHDLPYIARNGQSFEGISDSAAPNIIKHVIYDGAKFLISHRIGLPSGQTVLSLAVRSESPNEFARLCNDGLTIICEDMRPATVLHAMFDACLKTSDTHVNEHFLYEGFARFSQNVDILKIAEFSADVRQCPSKYLPETEAQGFIKSLKSENYETDQTRIPKLSGSPYARGVSAQLKALGVPSPPS